MNKKRAFSLIELMIVITIIGILAAVAVPAYSDYVVRSKISESLSLMQIMKNTVSEQYMVQGKMPVVTEVLSGTITTTGTDNWAEADVGYADKYWFTRDSNTQARIGIVFDSSINHAEVNGRFIEMAALGSATGVRWVCGTWGTGGGIFPPWRLLPAACQNDLSAL